MVKFIHCADIHLGRVQNNLEQRFLDFGIAFQHVVQEALQRQVDFLLISGDLFDKRNINARTLEQAVEILEPLKEASIPVIAIEGNHDKAFLRDKESWMTFLARRGYIVLLDPDFVAGKLVLAPYNRETCTGCYIDLPENVRVYGMGYLGRAAGSKLSELALELPEDKTNIVLLHAMVGRMGGELIGSIPKADVACLKERVAYLALGHGHNRYVVEKLQRELTREEDASEIENEVASEATTAEWKTLDNSVEIKIIDLAEEVEDTPGIEGDINVYSSTDSSTNYRLTNAIPVNSSSSSDSQVNEQMQLSLFDMIVAEIAVSMPEKEKSNEENLDLEHIDADTPTFPLPLTHQTGDEVFTEIEDFSNFWGHNPGAIEHCRLDEAGHSQGFFYVELSESEERAQIAKRTGHIKLIEHIPATQRPARMVKVDISGLTVPDAAYSKIFAEIRERVDGHTNLLLRVIITGEIGFDIIELDEEVVRTGITEICTPLILEIDVRANLPGFSVERDMEVLDRHSIEREVMRKKVDSRSEWRHLGDNLVDLIFEIKEDVLNGLPAEEIVAKVLAMAGDDHEDS